VLERIAARRVLILAALAVAVVVGGFAATSLASSTVYYLTPTELYQRTVKTHETIRLGGLVKAGTLTDQPVGRPGASGEYEFVITDGNRDVRVLWHGAIPGMLREGAGAVVEGSFAADATFVATQVIAKHDEVYTAPKAGETPAHRTSFP
jgi:cytochrome c-type biogenesis protein CcmE